MNEERDQLLCMCKIKGVDWHVIARESQRLGGVERLLSGVLVERSPAAIKTVALIQANLDQINEIASDVSVDISTAREAGARLVTVLDEEYPPVLRTVPNLPPFIFVRGTFHEADLRSVAVVGTREASQDGLLRARRMSTLLTKEGVVVISGLARGVDTVAHSSALEAGGRTIAVVGTGITRTFPSENAALSEEIIQNGAIVSQFWPRTPPATFTFPRRNVTMSGIAQGTLVVEASSTSGAKMQARIALEHGKKVFLLRSLVNSQKWAAEYADSRGAIIVDDVADVIRSLDQPDTFRLRHELPTQLELDLG